MIDSSVLDETLRNLFRNVDFPAEPAGLYDPLRYMIAIGGKRIRPRLCLTVYGLFNDSFPEEILGPAAGLELFHTFTLIHDDMMDRSALRRGQKTVWKKWSADTAVLSGDQMCIDSFRRVAQAPDFVVKDVLDLFSATAALVCEGQQMDMDFEKLSHVSMHQYLKMIGLKTAVLIACSAKMGALIAGAPSSVCEGLYQYGYNLGLAFQVADDYLDAYGDQAVFGKPIGGDILNAKKTWLTVRAMEKGVQGIPEALSAPATTPEEEQAKIARMMDLYAQAGVEEDARETITHYHERALAVAQDVCGIGALQVLRSFSDSLLGRTA